MGEYRTRAIITHGLYFLNPLFEGASFLAWCTDSIKKQVLIKSWLWWHGYGIHFQKIEKKIVNAVKKLLTTNVLQLY
jgi:hypothetical protein